MLKELLAKLLAKAKGLKKAEATGFTTPEDLASHIVERDALVEEIAIALEKAGTMIDETGDTTKQEIDAIKAQLVEMKKGIEKPVEAKQLTREAFLEALGKSVRAAWTRDNKAMGILGGFPNPANKGAEWANQRDVVFNKDTGLFTKASLGTPLGSEGGDGGSYVINPIYERELLRYGIERSDLYNYVRHIPMAAKEVSWPTLNRYNLGMTWHTSYGETYNQGGKPSFGARVSLVANTLACYIPWLDEFGEDIQINVAIGELFLEMFSEAYGQEFDNQLLLSNAAPYTGIFKIAGLLKKQAAGGTPMSVQMEDFRDAPLMIPRADRQEGFWLVHETMVTNLISRRNTLGDYIWMPPQDGGRPAKIAGWPYIECNILPTIQEVGAGEPFAIFVNPKRSMWHGDRKGTEIRRFAETTESLTNGEEFIRFRKRDAFKVIKPDLCVALVTAS